MQALTKDQIRQRRDEARGAAGAAAFGFAGLQDAFDKQFGGAPGAPPRSGGLDRALAYDDALYSLREAVHELRAYRNGDLPADRLNRLIGLCADDVPAGAARHHAIAERLIVAVLAADTHLSEVMA